MVYQPIVLGSGLSAWRLLQRTMPVQLESFSNSAEQKRLTDHFLEAATDIKSADSVVADRRVLSVALGAYGLQDDIQNKYFVKRVLEDGASSRDALANRLTDSRYQRLAKDFAFDGVTPIVGLKPEVANEMVDLFNTQSFALAVGDTQPSLRLALNAQSELERIASSSVSESAKWYLVMGNPPLRTVVETALGLPSSVGTLDVDRQLGMFKDQAQSAFGEKDVSAFSDPELMGRLIDRYLLKEQVAQGASLSSSSVALQLISP